MLAIAMGGSRTERPTDSEYVDENTAQGARESAPASTVRVGNEELATLRLGSADGPEALSPAAWRARYDEQGEIRNAVACRASWQPTSLLRRRVAMKCSTASAIPMG